jgi:hypothetical protein
MAKKVPAPKKPTPDSTQQLIDAIVAVKRLQEFIRDHGGLEKSLDAVAGVHELVELTGGFDSLKQALETVGNETAPQQT